MREFGNSDENQNEETKTDLLVDCIPSVMVSIPA